MSAYLRRFWCSKTSAKGEDDEWTSADISDDSDWEQIDDEQELVSSGSDSESPLKRQSPEPSRLVKSVAAVVLTVVASYFLVIALCMVSFVLEYLFAAPAASPVATGINTKLHQLQPIDQSSGFRLLDYDLTAFNSSMIVARTTPRAAPLATSAAAMSPATWKQWKQQQPIYKKPPTSSLPKKFQAWTYRGQNLSGMNYNGHSAVPQSRFFKTAPTSSTPSMMSKVVPEGPLPNSILAPFSFPTSSVFGNPRAMNLSEVVPAKQYFGPVETKKTDRVRALVKGLLLRVRNRTEETAVTTARPHKTTPAPANGQLVLVPQQADGHASQRRSAAKNFVGPDFLDFRLRSALLDAYVSKLTQPKMWNHRPQPMTTSVLNMSTVVGSSRAAASSTTTPVQELQLPRRPQRNLFTESDDIRNRSKLSWSLVHPKHSISQAFEASSRLFTSKAFPEFKIQRPMIQVSTNEQGKVQVHHQVSTAVTKQSADAGTYYYPKLPNVPTPAKNSRALVLRQEIRDLMEIRRKSVSFGQMWKTHEHPFVPKMQFNVNQLHPLVTRQYRFETGEEPRYDVLSVRVPESEEHVKESRRVFNSEEDSTSDDDEEDEDARENWMDKEFETRVTAVREIQDPVYEAKKVFESPALQAAEDKFGRAMLPEDAAKMFLFVEVKSPDFPFLLSGFSLRTSRPDLSTNFTLLVGEVHHTVVRLDGDLTPKELQSFVDNFRTMIIEKRHRRQALEPTLPEVHSRGLIAVNDFLDEKSVWEVCPSTEELFKDEIRDLSRGAFLPGDCLLCRGSERLLPQPPEAPRAARRCSRKVNFVAGNSTDASNVVMQVAEPPKQRNLAKARAAYRELQRTVKPLKKPEIADSPFGVPSYQEIARIWKYAQIVAVPRQDNSRQVVPADFFNTSAGDCAKFSSKL
ncbi:unnamed protein product [Amoebophrya sp. A120]|nr:unnamed protein product [Amoebophrya sp. A120]|eukprot:GSA120T00010241001.1